MRNTGMLKIQQIIMTDEDARDRRYELGKDI